jgi:hypothetical protein
MKHLKTAVALFVLTILTFTCALVWGGDLTPVVAGIDSPAPAAMVGFLQGTLFPVISSLLMGVVSMFLVKLGNKFHIDAISQKNNFLEKLAFQGITLAEEKAAQLVGSRSALSGDEKIDIAISHVLHFMPKISPAQAQSLVESILAQVSGVGSTGDTAYSQGTGVLGSTSFIAATLPS